MLQFNPKKKEKSHSILKFDMLKIILLCCPTEIPGLIVATVLVERIGRKPTMSILTLLAFILILPLCFHQNEIVSTALLFCTRMLLFATTASLTIYAKEVNLIAIAYQFSSMFSITWGSVHTLNNSCRLELNTVCFLITILGFPWHHCRCIQLQ